MVSHELDAARSILPWTCVGGPARHGAYDRAPDGRAQYEAKGRLIEDMLDVPDDRRDVTPRYKTIDLVQILNAIHSGRPRRRRQGYASSWRLMRGGAVGPPGANRADSDEPHRQRCALNVRRTSRMSLDASRGMLRLRERHGVELIRFSCVRSRFAGHQNRIRRKRGSGLGSRFVGLGGASWGRGPRPQAGKGRGSTFTVSLPLVGGPSGSRPRGRES